MDGRKGNKRKQQEEEVRFKEKPGHLSQSVEKENADKNRLFDNSAPLRPSQQRPDTTWGSHRGRNGWKQGKKQRTTKERKKRR